MPKPILLISDIHGNYPALKAIHEYFDNTQFEAIINCGDSLVYAPFPNETLQWLRRHAALSITGNTDKKILKLLRGKSFKKPGKQEKRIMYESTAAALTKKNALYLEGLKKNSSLSLRLSSQGTANTDISIGIFHGSPMANHEFLFDTTDDSRFEELAAACKVDIVVTGHSHTPYHKKVAGIHFINPGSVGRMFDGNPAGSCAILTVESDVISVAHHRIPYDVELVTRAIAQQSLPAIYSQMFQQGRKLN